MSGRPHEQPRDPARRVLTRALLACCAATIGVGVVGGALVALTPDTAGHLLPPVVALLALGQLGGLAAAAAVAVGLRRALVSPKALRGTGRAVGVVARVLVAACLLTAGAWALADRAGALVAVAGAVVSLQAAAVLAVVGRQLRSHDRPSVQPERSR
jgi:hypothetical protein